MLKLKETPTKLINDAVILKLGKIKQAVNNGGSKKKVNRMLANLQTEIEGLQK